MGVASARNGAMPLSPLRLSSVGHERHDDQFAVVLLGNERHRRRRQDIGDRRELLGPVDRHLDERRHDVRRGRQDQHAADDRPQVVEAKPKPRDDAEVAAAPSDGPEEVGMALLVDPEQLPVCGHDLGGEQVVDREAVGAHEKAHASAERDPADPDRCRVAEPRREPMLAGPHAVLASGEPRVCPCRAIFDIELERLHLGEIDHDAAVGGAVSGDAVPAASNGKVRPGLGRESNGARHVVRVGDSSDRGGPSIEAAVEDRSRLVVVLVVGTDDRPGEGGSKRFVRGGLRLHRVLLPSRSALTLRARTSRT